MKEAKPDGYAWVVPFLFVDDMDSALSFYEGVLGFLRAHVLEQDGTIAHAELRYRDRIVAMLAPARRYEASGESSAARDPAPGMEILVYVEDVNLLYETAIRAGAVGLEEPKDHPWGERIGRIRDPEGFRWLLTQNLGGEETDEDPA